MTDIEMTKLCAEAMGLVVAEQLGGLRSPNTQFEDSLYDPLRDDAQAMALVKEFGLDILWRPDYGNWEASSNVEGPDGVIIAVKDSLNRAIVECVARMRAQ